MTRQEVLNNPLVAALINDAPARRTLLEYLRANCPMAGIRVDNPTLLVRNEGGFQGLYAACEMIEALSKPELPQPKVVRQPYQDPNQNSQLQS